MNIKETFLNLTSKTYPNGTEEMLEKYLPNSINKDNYGNYFISIGNDNTVMFTSHLDTACKESVIVNHKFSADGEFVTTDGTSILGADDKAGVTIMLYMIHNKIPGLYYFFLGEEVGCKGSRYLSTFFNKDYPNINKIVSFDRRGTSSVITYQMWSRCCSNEFANALADELNKSGLNMKPDDTGVVTDSAQFVDTVPECTNISVGYYGEHTKEEKQNLFFLEKLCRAVCLVNWEKLPVKRDPSVLDYGCDYYGEFFAYNTSRYSMLGGNYNPIPTLDDLPSGLSYTPGKIESFNEYIESHIHDIEFSENRYSMFVDKGVEFKGYISQTYIDAERINIASILPKLGHDVSESDILWDGDYCWLDSTMEYIGSRKDLVDFLPSLDCIPSNQVKKEIKGSVGDDYKYYICKF